MATGSIMSGDENWKDTQYPVTHGRSKNVTPFCGAWVLPKELMKMYEWQQNGVGNLLPFGRCANSPQEL